jgi:hypothetical protein
MPTAKKWRKKVFLLKIETTYGTDAVPTGALNAMLATGVKFEPMKGSDVNRDLDLPYLSNQGSIPAELHATFSGKVELAPSGAAGTAPAWGPLLRVCGVAQTVSAGVSVTYNPITDNHEGASLYLYIDGTLYKALGVRGTGKFSFSAQGIPYFEFELTGLFSQPAEAANPAATLTAWMKPRIASKLHTPTFTINAVPMVMRSFELDLGNKVEPRFLIPTEEILIVDKAEMIKTQVQADLLSVIDPFALALAQTDVAVNLVHGTGAGNILTLNAPAAQMQRPHGAVEAQGIKEWPLSLMPKPTGTGNNQWTLVLT